MPALERLALPITEDQSEAAFPEAAFPEVQSLASPSKLRPQELLTFQRCLRLLCMQSSGFAILYCHIQQRQLASMLSMLQHAAFAWLLLHVTIIWYNTSSSST